MSTEKVNTPGGKNAAPPEKATTPDQLNKLLKITHPYHWVSISALGLLTLITIIWSIFGTVPTRVEGIGQITAKQGLHAVYVLYQGEVKQLYCKLGDSVKVGQVVAKLSQPALENELTQLNVQKDGMERQYDFLITQDSKNANIKTESNSVQADRVKKQIKSTEDKITFLKQREKEQEQLYHDGLITYDQYFKTKDDLNQAIAVRNQNKGDLINIQLGNQEWKLNNSLKEKDLADQITNLGEKIKVKEKEYEDQTNIKANANGVVSEVAVAVNDLVKPGQRLLTIEENGADAESKFELFVPYNTNSPIMPGMEVQIEPYSVDHNLYGWLIGDVVSVNHYVATKETLLNQFHDMDYVGLITKNGPVYQVEVLLRRDPTTFTKFAFSNKKGPQFQLQTGTNCDAYVLVKQKAPIDYVIPIFKDYFR